MYHSKKIALFISHIYGDYQQRLCTGIIKKAAEHGILVEIFTTNDGEDLGDYSNGEQSIMNIPKPESYAGVLFASNTYRSVSLCQSIIALLKEQFTCPVIDINNDASSFPQIILENNAPVKELVLHLAQKHGYSKICYLGNSDYPTLNQKRLDAYRQGLHECGLEDTDEQILIYSCANQTPDELMPDFLEQNRNVQAIVCYNDDLALTLIAYLERRGIRVPQDIAVTGCDTLEFGQRTAPVLTSITFPIEQIAETAVSGLLELIRGNDIPQAATVTASPHIGASCGCMEHTPYHAASYTHMLQNRIASLECSLIENMNMSAALQDVNDIDLGMDLIEAYADKLSFCGELYLCLYDGWNELSGALKTVTGVQDTFASTDTVLLKLALKNKVRLPECSFTKRNTLPDFVYSGSDSPAFLYTPLFFGSRVFGYIAMSCKADTIGYSFSFISWMMNVNSMLKNICDRNNMGMLTQKLEDLFVKDELTGIYNRQGLKLHVSGLLQKAAEEQKPLMAAIYELEDLKNLRKTFGHAEADLAVQALAHALENAMEESCICAYLGGDEFQVIGYDFTTERADALRNKINTYLDNYNKLHSKPYKIQTSCGYCISLIHSPDEVSSLLERAGKALSQP